MSNKNHLVSGRRRARNQIFSVLTWTSCSQSSMPLTVELEEARDSGWPSPSHQQTLSCTTSLISRNHVTPTCPSPQVTLLRITPLTSLQQPLPSLKPRALLELNLTHQDQHLQLGKVFIIFHSLHFHHGQGSMTLPSVGSSYGHFYTHKSEINYDHIS